MALPEFDSLTPAQVFQWAALCRFYIAQDDMDTVEELSPDLQILGTLLATYVSTTVRL